jgi:hypothetical protein
MIVLSISFDVERYLMKFTTRPLLTAGFVSNVVVPMES